MNYCRPCSTIVPGHNFPSHQFALNRTSHDDVGDELLEAFIRTKCIDGVRNWLVFSTSLSVWGLTHFDSTLLSVSEKKVLSCRLVAVYSINMNMNKSQTPIDNKKNSPISFNLICIRDNRFINKLIGPSVGLKTCYTLIKHVTRCSTCPFKVLKHITNSWLIFSAESPLLNAISQILGTAAINVKKPKLLAVSIEPLTINKTSMVVAAKKKQPFPPPQNQR